MTHKGTVTLETERLVLRQFVSEDWSDLHEYLSQPETVLYEPYEPFSVEESKQAAVDRSKSHDFLAVCLRSDGKLIGNLYIAPRDYESWELGYVFNSRFLGNGYATEAANAVIKSVFEKGARRVSAMCNPLNKPSWKLLERLGFRREGHLRQNIFFKRDDKGQPVWQDTFEYAIIAEDYFNKSQTTSNSSTIRESVDLMFHNLKIAMDTVDWNAEVCGAPTWRYIYHTLHSADKWFINPSKRSEEAEPSFHTPGLDWPDTPSDVVLSRETLYAYYEQVKHKILFYCDSLNDSQLNERPQGCTGTRLGLALSQFRHMYAHIGILNGVTIANTNRYPRVINESTWRSGKFLEGLYDVEERL